jgi:hypothetical protein
LEENDLVAEDFRSRDKSWDYCRIALGFFREHRIQFWKMEPADALVGNAEEANGTFALVEPGSLYLIYAPEGGPVKLDLAKASGTFSVRWFNPRTGGPLLKGSVASVRGGASVDIGSPPGTADWLAVVRNR